jgi:hypothetical protein
MQAVFFSAELVSRAEVSYVHALMYTVIRFTLARERAHELSPVGERMNETTAGVFEGIRAAKDGFACSVHDSDLWVDHQHAIASFISVYRKHIREAIELGAVVTFDVAVAPEDLSAQRWALILNCPPDLVAEIASSGTALEISIYRGRELADVEPPIVP